MESRWGEYRDVAKTEIERAIDVVVGHMEIQI
jgi:hypothetical protein